jgi:uncharacterized damage-inducible protein DinB
MVSRHRKIKIGEEIKTSATKKCNDTMKELLNQYATYNLWANQTITNAIGQLTQDEIHREIVSSFNSLFKTVLHLLDAESIWWQRMKLNERVESPSETFDGDFIELQKKLLSQGKLWEDWVANATDHQLQHVFAYQRSKSEQNKQQVCVALIHLFNHNSYHRGQIVTMLRQLGVTKIPSTDLNAYLRQKK